MKRCLIQSSPIDSSDARVEVTLPGKPWELNRMALARASMALRQCSDMLGELSFAGVASEAQIRDALKAGLGITKAKRRRRAS